MAYSYFIILYFGHHDADQTKIYVRCDVSAYTYVICDTIQVSDHANISCDHLS